MALGSIAENDDIRAGQSFGSIWAQPAFSLLGVVTMEHTITAVQCLLLFRFARYSVLLTVVQSLSYVDFEALSCFQSPLHYFNKDAEPSVSENTETGLGNSRR
jgi:hypothetical protein